MQFNWKRKEKLEEDTETENEDKSLLSVNLTSPLSLFCLIQLSQTRKLAKVTSIIFGINLVCKNCLAFWGSYLSNSIFLLVQDGFNLSSQRMPLGAKLVNQLFYSLNVSLCVGFSWEFKDTSHRISTVIFEQVRFFLPETDSACVICLLRKLLNKYNESHQWAKRLVVCLAFCEPQRSITDHLFASSVYASYQICLITLLKHWNGIPACGTLNCRAAWLKNKQQPRILITDMSVSINKQQEQNT